jgi:predicted negative regulator of RcsB-dependent stress response
MPPENFPPSPALGEEPLATGAFEQFLDRHQKAIGLLAVLLVLGAIGLIIYRGIDESRERTAGEALTHATDLASLKKVTEEHSGTAAAGSAEVLLAANQWTAGQQDDAIATLKSFIDSKPDHPARPSAQASLASKLVSQGKKDEAAAIYQSIADDPKARFLAPYALISLGDLAKDSGDVAKAEASYQKARNEFPESSFAETAMRRLSLLKAKAPTEISPPPAPAPELDATESEAPIFSAPPVQDFIPPSSNETPASSGEATPEVPKP